MFHCAQDALRARDFTKLEQVDDKVLPAAGMTQPAADGTAVGVGRRLGRV